MTENPFAASVVEDSSPAEQTRSTKLGSIARETFIAWEKLRLVYNAILVPLCIGLILLASRATPQPHVTDLMLWASCIFGGVVANACYFAGPIIETYVAWLGLPSRTLRYVLFTLGTLFTAVAAVASISATAMVL